MIPKGNQRGGGQQLATHLLNSFDNDRVEVADVRGAVANDLHGAFTEWHAQAKQTQCRKYLYSLSINPDHRQGPFVREQYLDFIGRAEKKLGLELQPRAVVFHTKGGREHCHVVWSRIDPVTITAVHMGYDRQKLRAVAQDFALDHGITLPEGMRNDRGQDRFPDHAKAENLQEKQQQERTGASKEDRRRHITEAWTATVTGPAFVEALAQKGYYLARGDKRAYVVVDLFGEVHSLSRQIAGVRARDIQARLAGYPVETLAAVAAAQTYARELRESRSQQQPSRAAEQQDRRAALEQTHAERRRAFEDKRAAITQQHLMEREGLRDLHRADNQGVLAARAARQPRGLTAFLTRITGIQLIVAAGHRRQDKERASAQGQQEAALIRRHDSERHDLDRRLRAIEALEKRERRSLETALHREEFQRIAAPARQPEPQRAQEAGKSAGLTGTQQEQPAPIKTLFNRLADIFRPQKQSEGGLEQQGLPPVRDDFTRAAAGAEPRAQDHDDHTVAPEPGPGTPAEPKKDDAGSLAAEFRRRAAQKERDEREQEGGRERHYRAPRRALGRRR